MNCPLCKIELKERKFKNIYGEEERAYQCFQCGGIFLENLGGLRVNKKEAEKLEEINFPLLKAKFPIQNRKSFRCPFCKNKMGKYINPLYKNFLILFCFTCKGMFFNQGELLRFSQKREKREKDMLQREKEILRKIYESEGKEALLKAIPVLLPDESEIKKRFKEEVDKKASQILLDHVLPFLIPFSRFPINLILNILLTLIPFIRNILIKDEEISN